MCSLTENQKSRIAKINKLNEKRFYTPQFSEMAAVTVRRLAWAMGLSMTKSVEQIIKEITLIFPSAKICPKCKDKTKCKVCGFYNQAAPTVNAEKIKKSAIAA
jgi:hypothetical protein